MDRSLISSVSFQGEEYILPAGLVLFGVILFFAWRNASALKTDREAREAASGKSSTANARKVLSPEDFRQFPLTKVTPISYNTAIYRFGLPQENDVLGLPIGQHISLSAQIEGQEKPVVRSYTPITSDLDKGHFDLIIKAYPSGNISKYVTGMQIGQMMDVRGPKGAMTYTPNMVRHIGMIAGGTGITPMLQISKAIIRGRPKNGGNDTTKVDLIFANVNYEDILLRDELEQLANEDSDFNVYHVLNNPPEKWSGGVGFVTTDIMKPALQGLTFMMSVVTKAKLPAPADDVKILVCGPPPMVSAMKKGLVELGYEKARPVSKLPDQVFCF